MVKLGRRKFLGLSASALTAMSLITFIEEQRLKENSYFPHIFNEYSAIVFGNPSTQYTAVTNNGEILFKGNCNEGSGTCGIYETIEYVQKVYGYGKIGLFGVFFPTKSPSISSNIKIGGNAILYVNPNTLPFIVSLAREGNIKILWYKNIGIINYILEKRGSFSLSPYVIFTTTSDTLLFANGDQAIGAPSSFTISIWVNGNPNPYGGYILSYGSVENGKIWTLQNQNNLVKFSGASGSVFASSPNTPFHVAVVCKGDECDLYINGINMDSNLIKINYISPAYIWINNFPINSQQGGLNLVSWKSYVENVQIYNSPLSSSQISQLATSPVHDPVDESIIFWALYRYIFYLGDLITGKGFQRMGGLLYGGSI
ncbi:LamG-like jellyroll fold domain-containing protein [Sulfolobus tengchongensis]|uniref:LamG-like jellyroll fold domain-containing protein n=1 Tax=Sulfolobus tengchongensis TaxID=207809 RepID=A0AAX4L1R9_9CREN